MADTEPVLEPLAQIEDPRAHTSDLINIALSEATVASSVSKEKFPQAVSVSKSCDQSPDAITNVASSEQLLGPIRDRGPELFKEFTQTNPGDIEENVLLNEDARADVDQSNYDDGNDSDASDGDRLIIDAPEPDTEVNDLERLESVLLDAAAAAAQYQLSAFNHQLDRTNTRSDEQAESGELPADSNEISAGNAKPRPDNDETREDNNETHADLCAENIQLHTESGKTIVPNVQTCVNNVKRVEIPADSLINPSDSVAKHADSAINPSDSVAKHADSAINLSDSVAKHADSAINPSDSVAKHADSAINSSDTLAIPSGSAKPADNFIKPTNSVEKSANRVMLVDSHSKSVATLSAVLCLDSDEGSSKSLEPPPSKKPTRNKKVKLTALRRLGNFQNYDWFEVLRLQSGGGQGARTALAKALMRYPSLYQPTGYTQAKREQSTATLAKALGSNPARVTRLLHNFKRHYYTAHTRTTMSALASLQPTSKLESLYYTRLLEWLDLHLPAAWRRWEVTRLSYRDLFPNDPTDDDIKNIRLIVPPSDLANIFYHSPARPVRHFTADQFLQCKRMVVSWPLGRALAVYPAWLCLQLHAVSGPHSAAARYGAARHGSARHDTMQGHFDYTKYEDDTAFKKSVPSVMPPPKFFTHEQPEELPPSIRDMSPEWVHIMDQYMPKLKLSGQMESKEAKEVVNDFLLVLATSTRGCLRPPVLSDLSRRYGTPPQEIKDIWQSWCDVVLEGAQKSFARGDDVARTSLTTADWRLLDVLLLYSNVSQQLMHKSISSEESVTALSLLTRLCIVYNVEAQTEAFRAVHHVYLSQGRVASIILLQRRWWELKRAAEKRPGVDHHATHPILKAIAKRYPNVSTRGPNEWKELVRSNRIVQNAVMYYEEEPWLSSYMPEEFKYIDASLGNPFIEVAQEEEEDIMIVERQIETIEIDDDECERDGNTQLHSEPERDSDMEGDNILYQDIAEVGDIQTKVILESDSDCNDIDNDNHIQKISTDIDREMDDISNNLGYDMQKAEPNHMKISKTIDRRINDTSNNLADNILGAGPNKINNEDTYQEPIKDDNLLLNSEAKLRNDILKAIDLNISMDDNSNSVGSVVVKSESVNVSDADGTSRDSFAGAESESENKTPAAIDPKLIMIPLVNVTSLHNIPAWNKHSRQGKLSLKNIDIEEFYDENYKKVLEKKKIEADKLKRKIECHDLNSINHEINQNVEALTIPATANLTSHLDEPRTQIIKLSQQVLIDLNIEREIQANLNLDAGISSIPVVVNPFKPPIKINLNLSKTRRYFSRGLCKNPDFNTSLKKIPRSFWYSERNRALINQCLPVTIDLIKLVLKKTNQIEIANEQPKGRVLKKIQLPDINDVRRINKNILTAAVNPINVRSLQIEMEEPTPSTTGPEPEREAAPGDLREILESLQESSGVKRDVACCAARRWLQQHAARRRAYYKQHYTLTPRARYQCPHNADECTCCCLAEVEEETRQDSAERGGILQRVRRVLSKTLIDIAPPSKSISNKPTETSIPPRIESVNKKSKEYRIPPVLERDGKRVRSRKKKKESTAAEPAGPSETEIAAAGESTVDGLDEWIREKNKARALFGFDPPKRKPPPTQPSHFDINHTDTQTYIKDKTQDKLYRLSARNIPEHATLTSSSTNVSDLTAAGPNEYFIPSSSLLGYKGLSSLIKVSSDIGQETLDTINEPIVPKPNLKRKHEDVEALRNPGDIILPKVSGYKRNICDRSVSCDDVINLSEDGDGTDGNVSLDCHEEAFQSDTDVPVNVAVDEHIDSETLGTSQLPVQETTKDETEKPNQNEPEQKFINIFDHDYLSGVEKPIHIKILDNHVPAIIKPNLYSNISDISIVYDNDDDADETTATHSKIIDSKEKNVHFVFVNDKGENIPHEFLDANTALLRHGDKQVAIDVGGMALGSEPRVSAEPVTIDLTDDADEFTITGARKGILLAKTSQKLRDSIKHRFSEASTVSVSQVMDRLAPYRSSWFQAHRRILNAQPIPVTFKQIVKRRKDVSNLKLIQTNTRLSSYLCVQSHWLVVSSRPHTSSAPALWLPAANGAALLHTEVEAEAAGTKGASPLCAPPRVTVRDALYYKLSDVPLVYAQVLTALPDICSVQREVSAAGTLYLYHRMLALIVELMVGDDGRILFKTPLQSRVSRRLESDSRAVSRAAAELTTLLAQRDTTSTSEVRLNALSLSQSAPCVGTTSTLHMDSTLVPVDADRLKTPGTRRVLKPATIVDKRVVKPATIADKRVVKPATMVQSSVVNPPTILNSGLDNSAVTLESKDNAATVVERRILKPIKILNSGVVTSAPRLDIKVVNPPSIVERRIPKQAAILNSGVVNPSTIVNSRVVQKFDEEDKKVDKGSIQRNLNRIIKDSDSSDDETPLAALKSRPQLAGRGRGRARGAITLQPSRIRDKILKGHLTRMYKHVYTSRETPTLEPSSNLKVIKLNSHEMKELLSYNTLDKSFRFRGIGVLNNNQEQSPDMPSTSAQDRAESLPDPAAEGMKIFKVTDIERWKKIIDSKLIALAKVDASISAKSRDRQISVKERDNTGFVVSDDGSTVNIVNRPIGTDDSCQTHIVIESVSSLTQNSSVVESSNNIDVDLQIDETTTQNDANDIENGDESHTINQNDTDNQNENDLNIDNDNNETDNQSKNDDCRNDISYGGDMEMDVVATNDSILGM